MENKSLTGTAGAGDLTMTVVGADTGPIPEAYKITPEQATFFKAETGIDDDDGLRAHILEVQAKAYKIFPYHCIRSFKFLFLGIAKQPEYENIIRLGRERPDEVLLDIGCCFGVDARKAVSDGFPLKNVVTSDLIPDFFHLGHDLFKTTPETYPITFVAGDVFDPNTLQIVPLHDAPPSTPRPDVSTLTSLNPLTGRCAVIFASNFFHLFSEEKEVHLAKALAGLLSPLPGSMICGEQVGNWEKGTFSEVFSGSRIDMLLHSPGSWTAVWDGGVFPKGTVKVEVKIERVEFALTPSYNRMQWSVVRL